MCGLGERARPRAPFDAPPRRTLDAGLVSGSAVRPARSLRRRAEDIRPRIGYYRFLPPSTGYYGLLEVVEGWWLRVEGFGRYIVRGGAEDSEPDRRRIRIQMSEEQGTPPLPPKHP